MWELRLGIRIWDTMALMWGQCYVHKNPMWFWRLSLPWKFNSITLAGVGAFLSNRPDSLALTHLLTHWPLGGHNVILKM